MRSYSYLPLPSCTDVRKKKIEIHALGSKPRCNCLSVWHILIITLVLYRSLKWVCLEWDSRKVTRWLIWIKKHKHEQKTTNPESWTWTEIDFTFNIDLAWGPTITKNSLKLKHSRWSPSTTSSSWSSLPAFVNIFLLHRDRSTLVFGLLFWQIAHQSLWSLVSTRLWSQGLSLSNQFFQSFGRFASLWKKCFWCFWTELGLFLVWLRGSYAQQCDFFFFPVFDVVIARMLDTDFVMSWIIHYCGRLLW